MTAISKAYDQTVQDFHEGRDWLDRLPKQFRESPELMRFLEECNQGASGSGAPEIREFLNPEPGMKFLDAGCSANLFNYRLDQWGAGYYGIDISSALVQSMRAFAAREGIAVGALEVAEVGRIPFPDNFFDIAACIGVLEYVELSYCERAIGELRRVLKPGGRMVFDIPNNEHPLAPTMFKLERCLGRPNIIKARPEVEALLPEFFELMQCHDAGVMIKYFLRARR